MSSAKPKPVAVGDVGGSRVDETSELPGIAEPASPRVTAPEGPSEDSLPEHDTPGSILKHIYDSKDVEAPKTRINNTISYLIQHSGLGDRYNFIFLHDDDDPISRFTTNQIYSALTGPSHEAGKDLLLVLYNYGGSVEAGYLISKACKKKCTNFIVTIPRFAKSAATLIALGADEIHMGIISEMGPIDPQVGDYPALGRL